MQREDLRPGNFWQDMRSFEKRGTVEFKTDNRGLFEFSLEEVRDSDWNLEVCTFDLHHDEELVKGNVMTEYEEKFSSMGKSDL